MCSPLTIAMKLASSPCRNSSITTVLPAAPNWPENIACAASIASSVVSQMMTPLPAARPSAFTTRGARCARTQACVEGRLRERCVGSRRDAMAAQEVLGESLGAFQPRCQPARAEAAQTRSFERVGDACHERRLRPDDSQRDPLAAREVDECGDIVRGDRHVCDAGLQRRAGVAWRDVNLLDARRLRGFPGERMLATAAAEDQNLHQCLK